MRVEGKSSRADCNRGASEQASGYRTEPGNPGAFSSETHRDMQMRLEVFGIVSRGTNVEVTRGTLDDWEES